MVLPKTVMYLDKNFLSGSQGGLDWRRAQGARNLPRLEVIVKMPYQGGDEEAVTFSIKAIIAS